MVQAKPPLIYILIYSKFKEKAQLNPYMSKSDIDPIFGRIIRIPNVMKLAILDDMESFNLIKKINKQKWKVLNYKCEKILNNMRKNNWRWKAEPSVPI